MKITQLKDSVWSNQLKSFRNFWKITNFVIVELNIDSD